MFLGCEHSENKSQNPTASQFPSVQGLESFNSAQQQPRRLKGMAGGPQSSRACVWLTVWLWVSHFISFLCGQDLWLLRCTTGKEQRRKLFMKLCNAIFGNIVSLCPFFLRPSLPCVPLREEGGWKGLWSNGGLANRQSFYSFSVAASQLFLQVLFRKKANPHGP